MWSSILGSFSARPMSHSPSSTMQDRRSFVRTWSSTSPPQIARQTAEQRSNQSTSKSARPRHSMKPVLALDLFLLLSVLAANVRAQDGPPMPYIDKGACPFECCTYRQWSVKQPTAVLSE